MIDLLYSAGRPNLHNTYEGVPRFGNPARLGAILLKNTPVHIRLSYYEVVNTHLLDHKMVVPGLDYERIQVPEHHPPSHASVRY